MGRESGQMGWADLELEMLTPARERWVKLSLADREVLAYALRDAIANPHRVGSYTHILHKLRCGEVIDIHQFRFGYANFILAETKTYLVVCDLWLDHDIALAAE